MFFFFNFVEIVCLFLFLRIIWFLVFIVFIVNNFLFFFLFVLLLFVLYFMCDFCCFSVLVEKVNCGIFLEFEIDDLELSICFFCRWLFILELCLLLGLEEFELLFCWIILELLLFCLRFRIIEFFFWIFCV